MTLDCPEWRDGEVDDDDEGEEQVLTGEPVVTAETAAARAAATAALDNALVVNGVGGEGGVAATALDDDCIAELKTLPPQLLLRLLLMLLMLLLLLPMLFKWTVELLASELWYDLTWKFKLCSYLNPLPHAKQTNECILCRDAPECWYRSLVKACDKHEPVRVEYLVTATDDRYWFRVTSFKHDTYT